MLVLDAKELLAAAKIASKSDRDALQTVKVEFDKQGYKITATDSYKLVQFSNYEHQSEHEGVLLLDSNFIKTNLRASDTLLTIDHPETTQGNPLRIDILYKRVNALRANLYDFHKDVNYPRSTKELLEIKPDPEPVTVSHFNPSYIMEICDAIKTAYGKNTPFMLEFLGKNKPAILSAIYGASSFKGLIMPVRMPK